MDITLDELKIIADEQGFNIVLLEKDYLISYLLCQKLKPFTLVNGCKF